MLLHPLLEYARKKRRARPVGRRARARPSSPTFTVMRYLWARRCLCPLPSADKRREEYAPRGKRNSNSPFLRAAQASRYVPVFTKYLWPNMKFPYPDPSHEDEDSAGEVKYYNTLQCNIFPSENSHVPPTRGAKLRRGNYCSLNCVTLCKRGMLKRLNKDFFYTRARVTSISR